jgi:membrane dipeptidase
MKTKHLLYFSLLTALLWGCKEAPETLEQKALRIHKNVMTLDTHADINVANFKADQNYTQDLDTQVNLPKMVEGGLDVAWFIVYTGQGPLDAEGYEKAANNAQEKFEAIARLTQDFAPDQIGLATTSDAARTLWKAGKKVAMIGVENAYPLGLDTANVKKFYDLGARYMSLAHNGHSQFSDSNTGEYEPPFMHNGISELGKQIIEKMNYYGIMVDLSHPSKEAIAQTIAHSKAPVIASHSSARALSDHARNLDDEQLEWIKTNGGVVQAVALALYVKKEKHEQHQAAQQEVLENAATAAGMELLDRRTLWGMDTEERTAYLQALEALKETVALELAAAAEKFPPVNVSDFVDHIDYMVQKMGIDHVGISSDFDGGGGVEGWRDASETYNVTLELVKRGYSEEEIHKIWSGNLLRVLDDVTATAQALQGKKAL